MKLIVGLGNPGKEYENTRHNAGRIVVGMISKKSFDTKIKFITPDSFMNNSGKIVAPLIKNKKDLQNLIVIYDDIDIPIGKIKISFNRSSGGHNGLESIIKNLKSKEFLRIRIGVASTTVAGKIKKPKGGEQVTKFLLGDFKKEELVILKKVAKDVAQVIEIIQKESYQKAMTLYN